MEFTKRRFYERSYKVVLQSSVVASFRVPRYHTVIKTCVHHAEWSRALGILLDLVQRGLDPPSKTLALVLSGPARRAGPAVCRGGSGVPAVVKTFCE